VRNFLKSNETFFNSSILSELLAISFIPTGLPDGGQPA
jgi:hypothetical protein